MMNRIEVARSNESLSESVDLEESYHPEVDINTGFAASVFSTTYR